MIQFIIESIEEHAVSLEKEKAKAIIDSIFEARSVKGPNTLTLAQSINLLANDTLSGDKYIGELLQNADDAGSDSVSFIVIDGYLIFTHKGKHFTEQDIQAICDAASPHRLKVEQHDQIGNKGIGFKAVFSLASEVSILSNYACFRFDENYECWEGHSERFPWQLIPIHTELNYFPQSVSQHYHKDSVHVIFKLRPAMVDKVHEQLKKFRGRHLLFLRHVKNCTIFFPNEQERRFSVQKPKRILKPKNGENADYTIYKLVKNQSEQQAWWIYHKECPLPASLKTQLSQASNIPEKYKRFQSIPISIAFLESKGELLPLPPGPKIFCYLATDLDFNINFAFNAEFLLDTSRMHLRNDPISDAWNQFILTCMLKEHVRFLHILALNSFFWKDVFHVLSHEFIVPERFESACKKNFDEAIITDPLVTNLPDKNLLRCRDAWVDCYDFAVNLGDDALKQNTAHPQMRNRDIIIKLGAKRFQSANVMALFKENWFLNKILMPENNNIFIELMIKMIAAVKPEFKANIQKAFQSHSLILDNQQHLRRPTDVCFPNEKLKYATRDFDFIVLLHPILCSVEPKWLSEQGVKQLSLSQIVEMANNERSSLVRFLVALATSSRVFSPEDWKILASLKVVTAEGKAELAANVYLSDALTPTMRLQDYFAQMNPLICHPDYTQGQSEDNFKRIRIFLVKIGVKFELCKSILTPIVAAANQTSQPKQLISLTLALYRHYFNKEEWSNKVIKAFSSLKIVCLDNIVRASAETYLADCYNPQTPLQNVVDKLPFVSEAYCVDDFDAAQLARFFVTIGVTQTIAISVHDNNPHRTALEKKGQAKKYFNYLESTHTPLCTYATRKYMEQHFIAGVYVDIPFVDQLLGTPIFWEVLRDNWDRFSDGIKDVRYKTHYDDRKIISNVHYLVILAMQCHYGEDAKPEDFFSQAFANELSGFMEEFKIAQETAPLTLEQSLILGFKGDITVQEGRSLLTRIADANQPKRDFSKIAFLYRKLIDTLIAEDPSCTASNIRLLARDNQFKPATQLNYILRDCLPDSKSERLIKKPKTIEDADFIRICQSFNIRRITVSELTVVFADEQASEIAEVLQTRIEFLIFAIASLNDWSEAIFKTQYKELAVKFREKLSRLTFICANKVEVQVDDFIKEEQEYWVDEESYTVYHLPYVELDHYHKQALLEFCAKAFGITDHQDVFLSIMTSPVRKLESKYEYEMEQAAEFDMAPSVCPQTNPLISGKVKPLTPIGAEFSDDEQVAESPTRKKRHFDAGNNYSPNTVGSHNHSSLGGSHKRRKVGTPSSDGSSGSSIEEISVKRYGAFFSERFTEEQRKELGRKGEAQVYAYLKSKHTEKYQVTAITENEEGYNIQRGDGSTKQVSWLNKNGERSKPYDFEIIIQRADGSQKKRHLEVKTTMNALNKIEISYSAPEWTLMQADEETENTSHRLFVVKASFYEGNMDFSKPEKINVIKNLADKKIQATQMTKLTIPLTL